MEIEFDTIILSSLEEILHFPFDFSLFELSVWLIHLEYLLS